MRLIKLTVQKILKSLGFEIYRTGPSSPRRTTPQIALQIAAQNGLQVNSVIDIGAAFGSWTTMCRGVFPNANYVLIEPLAQYDEWLHPLLSRFPNTTHIKAVVTDKVGQTPFFLHEDLMGSSLFPEAEGDNVNGTTIQVNSTTVDDIVAQQKLVAPFLLKIDVQGAELQVLQGAISTLPQTEYVLVETSLFHFFKNGPLAHDLIAYMRQQGFVIYDIVGFQYRLLDNALGQVDLAFVSEHSPLRKEHVYASAAQRLKQTQQIKQNLTNNKQ